MPTPKVYDSEYKFCQILWANEPVKSRELVRLCQEQLGWKSTTTYTVIKRLSQRGVLKDEDTIVTSLVSKEEVQASQLEELVDKTFDGSLPAFVAAFTRHRNISEQEIDEVQAMIDSIMAFRGSFDDTVEDEGVRNVVKCGWTAERCILYLRLGEPDRMCLKEMSKLIDRVKRTPVRTRSFAFAELLKATALGDGGKLPEERGDLIHAAEELVEI